MNETGVGDSCPTKRGRRDFHVIEFKFPCISKRKGNNGVLAKISKLYFDGILIYWTETVVCGDSVGNVFVVYIRHMFPWCDFVVRIDKTVL